MGLSCVKYFEKGKISIVIPIYKVEPYLHKCIDSILAQTYTNLEIILVDDGSPDRCPEICDEYAKKDSRINVIHKENGGLSDARNAGLDICSGEYIAFVDSDDWIEPYMYEKLLDNMIRFSAEMSIGGVSDDIEENGDYRSVKLSAYGETEFSESNTDAMKRYFLSSWAAWDKLYIASLFDGIRYPRGEINEDEAIVLQLLERCRTVCYTNEVCYHYVRRPESITTSSFSLKKLAWYRHCKANLEWIREHHPELTELAAARYRSSILWSLTEIALSNQSFKNEVKVLCAELRAGKTLFKRIPYRYRTDQVRVFLLMYLPFSWYRTLIRLKRKL